MCVCEFFLPLFYFFYEIRSVKGHYSKFDFLHEYRIEPVKSGSVFLRWSSVPGAWSGGAFPRRISQDNSSSRTTLWQLSGGNLSGGVPWDSWYICTYGDTYLISSYEKICVRYGMFLCIRASVPPRRLSRHVCPGGHWFRAVVYIKTIYIRSEW